MVDMRHLLLEMVPVVQGRNSSRALVCVEGRLSSGNVEGSFMMIACGRGTFSWPCQQFLGLTPSNQVVYQSIASTILFVELESHSIVGGVVHFACHADIFVRSQE